MNKKFSKFFLFLAVASIELNSSCSTASGHRDPANFLSPNPNLAQTAYQWLNTEVKIPNPNTQPQTYTYYLHGHVNPFLSSAEKPSTYWDYWCAGFVRQVALAANGVADPELTLAAPDLNIARPSHLSPWADEQRIAAQACAEENVPSDSNSVCVQNILSQKFGAKVALGYMKAKGRLITDMSIMPIGAAVFWSSGAYGHVAIFSGNYDNTGSALIISTGWPGRPGTQLRSLSSLVADLGPPAGWVSL